MSWAPEADAKLMHGTSGFDLADMFANPPDGDERAGRTYRVERALYSLGYWRGRVFSATVDQFLAFMQYGYGPLCMLPVLADSVVVVDEVHSFDRNMFSALKDFLREFNVPVLCMTATLMNDRRDDLIACGLRPPADWPDDLQKLADLPRYTLRRVPARAAAEAAVKTALARGKRVLWVVNQVKRAHQIVRDLVPDFDPGSDTTELRTEVGGKAVPVFCYHSRFKLADRVKRHSDVMRALKDEPGPALGVTTQVCEMSLDIDVDLLVTEECPVTALVQRMGRCNRDSKNPRPLAETGEVLVYPPEDGTAPYSDNDLKGLDEFLRTLDGRECSQALLEHTLVNLKTLPEPAGDVLSRFLASGPYAVAPKDDEEAADGGFREDNDFNRPCVLPEEVAAYNAALREARPGFVVPVPRRYGHGRDDADPGHQELPGYLGVAAGGRYHPAVGYWDQTRDDWTEGGR